MLRQLNDQSCLRQNAPQVLVGLHTFTQTASPSAFTHLFGIVRGLSQHHSVLGGVNAQAGPVQAGRTGMRDECTAPRRVDRRVQYKQAEHMRAQHAQHSAVSLHAIGTGTATAPKNIVKVFYSIEGDLCMLGRPPLPHRYGIDRTTLLKWPARTHGTRCAHSACIALCDTDRPSHTGMV